MWRCGAVVRAWFGRGAWAGDINVLAAPLILISQNALHFEAEFFMKLDYRCIECEHFTAELMEL